MIRYLKIAILLPCLMLMGAGFKYGGIKHDITVTAKSGATTTLTASSSQVQSFTGTSAQTVNLPSGLTLSNGYWFTVNNEGTTGSVVVRDASASVLSTLTASQSSTFYMNNALVIGGNWSVIPGAGTGSGGGGGGGGGGGSVASSSLTEAPMIHLSHGNGYGSTNTMIRRFSRINKNSAGSHVTLTQSSTNGDSFTINTAGMYAICYGDFRNGDMAVAITVNDSAMTTTARTPITYAQGLRSMYNGVSLNDYGNTCDVTDLAVNDVVRAHSDGNNTSTDQHSYFYIIYLGSQSGNELYVDGGTGYGSTNTLIRTWTNTRLNTGSAFTYTQDATNGDSITVNSDGLYWVCRAELRTSSGQVYSGITVNDSALSTDVYSMTYAQGRRFTNLLASGYYTQTSQNCGPLSLTSGDVIRGHDTAGSLSNGTDARVSIKAIKMNSSRRATFFDTPSGYGSVATKLRYMSQVRDYGASIGYGLSGLYGTTLATFSGGVYVGCLQDYGATVPTSGVMINPKAESSNISTSRDYNDGFRGIRANGAGSSSSHHCAFDYMGPGGQIAFGSDGSGGGTDVWISFAGALIN